MLRIGLSWVRVARSRPSRSAFGPGMVCSWRRTPSLLDRRTAAGFKVRESER